MSKNGLLIREKNHLHINLRVQKNTKYLAMLLLLLNNSCDNKQIKNNTENTLEIEFKKIDQKDEEKVNQDIIVNNTQKGQEKKTDRELSREYPKQIPESVALECSPFSIITIDFGPGDNKHEIMQVLGDPGVFVHYTYCRFCK